MKILILGLIAIAIFLFSQKIAVPQVVGSSEIMSKIESKANSWGLEPALVKAVAKVESNFNPLARNFERSPEDYDDSFGLMQITPMLAQDYGLIKDYKNLTWLDIDMLFNVDNNLSVACSFMKRLHSKYSFNQAVQMYNVGESGYNIYGFRNTAYLEKVKVAYGKYS